ncbi:nitroreductase family protein [Candidatus Borrarchaeum sp.]|uniref:nitroreductase family protein n=1 Tax=Candidatus Borrarchaeum sp. TaxID=2846742 RepID=UPI00257DE63C|nr:nitroreductase family protein [Candidatus Borrarchaeum sp.]
MIQNVMKRRRSIRKFKKDKFGIEKLCSILKASLLAPSGADQSPFTLIIIDNEQLKRQIRTECEVADKDFHEGSPAWLKEWFAKKNITTEKKFLTDAPFLVVLAGNTTMPYWLESTWISIAYLILAAEEEGLATLTYTPGQMKFLMPLLELPEVYEPVVILPIGYPDEFPTKIDNGDKETKIFFNKFGVEENSCRS